MLRNAPRFREISDVVFEILDGVTWMGHNIPFDIRIISMEFERIGRTPPRPLASAPLLPIHITLFFHSTFSFFSSLFPSSLFLFQSLTPIRFFATHTALVQEI